MSLDGVFIHYLVDELKNNIVNTRINKFNVINNSDFYLLLHNHKTLFISINSNNPHIILTNNSLVNSNKMTSFETTLKKYLTSSIITNIEQYKNDRIIIISFNHFDDLGYISKMSLVFELFGRNANILLLDENNVIVDCNKRKIPTEDSNIIVLPKMIYDFNIFDQNKVNPFLEKASLEYNNFSGVSNLLFQEMQYFNSQDIIFNEIKPCIMMLGKKKYFYAFPLHFANFEYIYFDSLSELLESFYLSSRNDKMFNNEQVFLNSYIKKELDKTKTKLVKQNEELIKAFDNMKYEKIGHLLASNIHLVKKGMNSIKVNDFYNNNEEIIIQIDPLLQPNKNLENVYNKFKKAKRTIEHLNEQIELTNEDILYYECLLEQLNLAKSNEIKEIYQELNIKDKLPKRYKESKPNITIYQYDDALIYVGKNNIQNNYLTNKFANNNDYFFHVQGVPGSHTILRTTNLTNEIIDFTATIASCYSKYKSSSNVAVDYTLIKYVKKIKGNKGSFVSYSNQKTIFVTPNIDLIKPYLKVN